MNFKKFSSNPVFFSQAFTFLGIITRKTKIIKLEIIPDFDMSEYKRDITSDYFYTGNWKFDQEIKSVSQFKFISRKIYHQEDLLVLSKETGLPYDSEKSTEFLNEIFEKYPSELDSIGFDTEYDLDDFKIKELRVRTINNESRQVDYEGTFLGDSYYMDQIDWAIYSTVQIQYLPMDFDLEFYKELIFESYNHYKNDRFLLGYFMAYIALECFINLAYQKNSEKQDIRLSDKLNKIFKDKFGQIDKHPIYTHLINYLPKFTENRNAIAHGKYHPNINKELCKEALSFVLTLILSHETSISKFDLLNSKLQTEDFKY